MDISDLKPTERTIEIKHPVSDEPIGIRISLVSLDDPKLISLRRQLADKRNKAAMRNKPVSAEEVEHNENLLMFTTSNGWVWYNPTGEKGNKGFKADAQPNFHGEVPEFNQKNFIAVMKELPWMRRQIAAELDEEKDFFVS